MHEEQRFRAHDLVLASNVIGHSDLRRGNLRRLVKASTLIYLNAAGSDHFTRLMHTFLHPLTCGSIQRIMYFQGRKKCAMLAPHS